MKNTETSKWELIINNKVFRKTAGEEIHLLPGLEKYKNFNTLGVTEIVLVNGTIFKLGGDVVSSAPTIAKKIIFDVNQRYDFMEKIITMITKRKIESSIITGSPGLGKTYTVMACLKDTGMEEVRDYAVVKGYSTPKGLYRTLFENKDKIIVFDDCDSILKDPTARNLLKGALDSYERRTITWNSEAACDELPKTFDFTGHIIFISNMTLPKFDQALISRSMVIDLSMTDDDVLERMKHVLANVLPTVSMEKKEMALEFISIHRDKIDDLNFRILLKTIKIINSFETDWENLSLYAIQNG
jgi:hypothetical protein